MADVAVAVEKIIPAGIDPAHTGSLSASNNYQLINDGRMFLYVTNGGGSPCVVTIVSQKTDAGLALADRTVSVTNGEDRMIGPFPPQIYNDANGKINVTLSFITSVTLAALYLG